MSSVSALSSSSTSSVLSSAGESALGKDDFMMLLVTELINQNPLDPMDNKEFVSQMAQFSTLEQMTNMSSSIDTMTASNISAMKSMQISMIGKNVTATIDNPLYDEETAEENPDILEKIDVEGVIDRIKFVNSLPVAVVGDYDVNMEDITASW